MYWTGFTSRTVHNLTCPPGQPTLQKHQHPCKAVSTPCCSMTAELRSARVLQSPKNVLFRSFKLAEIININIYSYSLIYFLYNVEHSLKILRSALLTLSQKARLLLPANLAGLYLSTPAPVEPWAGLGDALLTLPPPPEARPSPNLPG